jgi:hypothetical protein
MNRVKLKNINYYRIKEHCEILVKDPSSRFCSQCRQRNYWYAESIRPKSFPKAEDEVISIDDSPYKEEEYIGESESIQHPILSTAPSPTPLVDTIPIVKPELDQSMINPIYRGFGKAAIGVKKVSSVETNPNRPDAGRPHIILPTTPVKGHRTQNSKPAGIVQSIPIKLFAWQRWVSRTRYDDGRIQERVTAFDLYNNCGFF